MPILWFGVGDFMIITGNASVFKPGGTTKPNMKKVSVIILISFFFAITAAPALAYLDPGTGSMILQIVIGAVAGALMAIKAYWYKISTFFRAHQRSDNKIKDDDPT